MKLDKIGIISVPVGMYLATAIHVQKYFNPAYKDTQKRLSENLYSITDVEEYLKEKEKDELPYPVYMELHNLITVASKKDCSYLRFEQV